MRIEFIKNFLKVVETGSIKRASRELGVSVSTLSFQIGQVEKFYGAKLLKRGTNGVVLTEEGKIAYENMKKIVESISEAKRRIMEVKSNEITIASGMVGVNVVFNLQTLLKTEYPDIKVNIVLRGAHDCVDGLLRGEYTYAIVGDVKENERLVCEVVGKDKLVLIVSPQNPLSKRDVVSVEDLKSYPLVTLTENYGITTSIKKALELSGYSLEDFNVAYTVDDYFTLLNLVSKNRGIAITSLSASYKACEMGFVIAKRIEGLKDERDVFFVTTEFVLDIYRYKEIAKFIIDNLKVLFESFNECV